MLNLSRPELSPENALELINGGPYPKYTPPEGVKPLMTDQEIDDKIDYWHDHPELNMPLYEYLGWTWEEYKAWVENRYDDGAQL